jgi:guanylate kinase
VNGKDYFFLTKAEFEERIHTGDLVEWEEIYGNYYGTLKSEISRALHQGRMMLFDVDVKGALSIQKHFPNDSILIFIQPPSFAILKQRLENRNTENPETLKRRLERVPMEMEKGRYFDFQVVNDDLQKAVDEVDEIVQTNMKNNI